MPRIFLIAAMLMSFVTTAGAVGSSDYSSPNVGVLQAANQLLKQQRYADAYQKLQNIDGAPEDDRQNLLGFSARKQGNYEVAAVHYEKALMLNPRHVGALEYQGELFIALGQMDKAQANLSKIMRYCEGACPEASDLRKAISKALK